MGETSNSLKEYTEAPVGEVTLAIHFKRLSKLSVYRLARFIDQRIVDGDFSVSEQNEIAIRFETELAEWASPSLRFGPAPLGVCFSLMNQDRTKRVMVQADRFSVTWLRQEDNEYARYENVLGYYTDELSAFESWLLKEKLASLEIEQCEIQYINFVEEDGNAAKYFNFIDLSHFKDPEGIHFVTSQRLTDTDEVGRLYLEATSEQRIIRNSAKEVELRRFLKVMLTFRGQPKKIGNEGIISHFQRGRHAIVSTFSSILSDVGRNAFGEKDRSDGSA